MSRTKPYPAAQLNRRFPQSPIDALISLKVGCRLRRQIPVRLDFDTLAPVRITVILQRLIEREKQKARTVASSGFVRVAESLEAGLLAPRRHIRATAMRHFRRHADALTQRRVRVNGLADVDGIGAHLNRQGNLANHVARMGADHAAAQNLAVAPASMAAF